MANSPDQNLTPLQQARQKAKQAAERFEAAARQFCETIMKSEIDEVTWLELLQAPELEGPIAIVVRVRDALSTESIQQVAGTIYQCALTEWLYRRTATTLAQSAKELQEELEKYYNLLKP